jgi:hypothetical protein
MRPDADGAEHVLAHERGAVVEERIRRAVVDHPPPRIEALRSAIAELERDERPGAESNA